MLRLESSDKPVFKGSAHYEIFEQIFEIEVLFQQILHLPPHYLPAGRRIMAQSEFQEEKKAENPKGC